MSEPQEKSRRRQAKEILFPLVVLLLVTLVVYGPLINHLGYYNEDWYHLLFVSEEGPESLISLYEVDRPFMGWLNYFDYLLVGSNLLAWNVYALICRFLIGVGVFWVMRLLWPKQSFASFAVAVIVLVYPGFLSQPHAINYKNYLFEYALAIFSIALMLKWIQEEKQTWKVVYAILSLLFASTYILIYEFMISLEATRILLLGYFFWRQTTGTWKKTLLQIVKFSALYVVVAGVFAYWRLFVFEASRVAVSEGAIFAQFVLNPSRMLLRVFFETAKDFLEAVVFAWAVPSYRLISTAYYRDLGQALIFAILAAGLLLGYLWMAKKWKILDGSDHQVSKSFILLGILSTVFSLLTIVIPGRDIQFNGFERYSLHATFGIALLIVGVLLAFPRNYAVTALVVLTAISTSTHYLNANKMKEIWDGQKEVWWQVSWRIPQIEGTPVVFVNYPPSSGVEQDYEIFGPLNLIYDDADFFVLAEVLNSTTVTWIELGLEKNDSLRKIELPKDFSSILVLSIPSTKSCLHVHDGSKLELSEYEDLLTRASAPYSQIDHIDLGSDFHTLPEEIFGPEPEHRWCYYYQKASLARQVGDWEDVVQIFYEAEQNGYRANDRVEWMPFFEAYVNLGMYEEARGLASIINSSPNMAAQLCINLPEDPGYPGEYDYEKVSELLCKQE